MFIILAVIAAAVSAELDLLLVTKEKSAKECVRVVVRNLLAVSFLSIAFQRFVLKYEHFLDTAGYVLKDYIKFFLWALLIGLAFEVLAAFIKGALRCEPADKPERPKLAMAMRIVTLVLVFLGAAAYTGTVWGREAFGNVTGDQLLINLTSPTEGTESSVYTDGFEGPVFLTLLYTVIFGVILFAPYKLTFSFKEKRIKLFGDLAKRILCLALACGAVVQGVSYGIRQFSLEMVFNSYVLQSSLIEKQYADPETANITWPEKKRNLIHIYLESMEFSFAAPDYGGYMDENLIPHLCAVADKGTVFSDTEQKYGGPQCGTGTQWSIASMVNQITGLPMKAPGLRNGYGSEGNFLPGAYTLGELLEAQGYEQTVMFGASANFGALRYLFETHGNWKIMDLVYARNNGLVPKDYKVNWGYEDDKLYEFAKDEITRLYETGKPFNFTMETADTHRPDGYVTPGKKTPYDQPYANALWNSDKDFAAFLKWIQKQPFYENTTVVIIGDHLSMETTFFKVYPVPEGYERRQYNVILNPAPTVGTPDENVTRNRLWSNWDYFPTIVAAMGGQIEGERLGIGTNLFSGEPTLYEEFGVDYVNREFEKSSKFYNKQILGVEKLIDAMK